MLALMLGGCVLFFLYGLVALALFLWDRKSMDSDLKKMRKLHVFRVLLVSFYGMGLACILLYLEHIVLVTYP